MNEQPETNKNDIIDESLDYPVHEVSDTEHIVNSKEIANHLAAAHDEEPLFEEPVLIDDLGHQVAEEAPEELVEQVPEAVSDDSGDYEVYGTDKDLVNHVVSEIHATGKTATVHGNSENLTGGKPIILCGDDWDAFVRAGQSNAESKAPVIQLQCEMNHTAMDAGYKTAAHVVGYLQDEDKASVAKRICNLL